MIVFNNDFYINSKLFTFLNYKLLANISMNKILKSQIHFYLA